MIDLMIIAVLTVVLGMAALYVYKAKKRGQKCIGCPYARQCAAKKGGCACQGENE